MITEPAVLSPWQSTRPTIDLPSRRDYITLVFRPLLVLLLVVCTTAFSQVQIAPATGQENVPHMQFPNSDVRDVLAFYERLTGKRIIYDNSVQGNVNIVVNTPVPKEEAVKIIEINLLLNGFSLIPEDDHITKVIGIGKIPRSAAVPIYSEIDQMPDSERVVTFLFKLQYADATEMQQILLGQQYIAPTNYTNVVALPKARALLITESTGVIRSLARVISEIDVPPAEVVSEFIKLERADVKDVLEKLKTIFEPTPAPGGATSASAPVARAPSNPNEAPPPNTGASQSLTIESGGTGLSEDTIVIGKIRLTADVRTNRLHVITRPINLPFVRKLIREFDSDVPFGTPAKRTLKFISATDVLDIVVKAITEPGVKSEDAASSTQTGGRQNPSQTNATNNSSLGTSNSAGGGGGFNISEELSTQPVDTTPKAVTVGNTKIIADPRENTIIVLGNKEVQQRVFDLLDQIDVRTPQVMLNTVIGELTLNDDQEFGVDYLLKSPAASFLTSGSGAATGLGFPFNIAKGRQIAATQGTSLGAAAAAAAGIASGGGLNTLIGATDSLDVIVHALDSTGRFRITNRPMVFTSNNKKAVIASGQEIAVPTQTLSNVTNGVNVNNTAAVQSSVEFKRVALQLEVVPLINSDREVSLDILQKLDSLVPGGDRTIGGNAVPTISTRYIKTNVSVSNRATVVLGGLITRTGGSSMSGVPLVSRIPVLGYLFKNTTKKNDRAELIVLIRPVVSSSPFEVGENSKIEQDRLLIEPNLDVMMDKTAPRPKATPNAVNFRYHDPKEMK
ncbi:MAG: ral secretion pathway protein [Chthoniobacter sp.]|nr:ral secretion pathway protein [Chthoniobacter sp.]